MESASEITVTPRQLEMLRHIAEFENSRCYSATIAEAAGAAGVSRTTAFEHIVSLQAKGLLTKSTGRARSLRLTAQASRLLECDRYLGSRSAASEGVPLAGRVAAGVPIEAIENADVLSLRSVFGDGDGVFALEVAGDSMIEEGIDTGDYVICRKTDTAANGQMVVAIVEENAATVKRFYRENGRVRLEAANPAYPSIYTDQCRIEAVVVGVLRRLGY
ncbi:MAG: repressor LexA [Phycisphaerae bacterium]|nr:repressor LexA [Phycisphaerae bacterium]